VKCAVTATELDDAGCGVGAGDDGTRVHVADLLPASAPRWRGRSHEPAQAEAWGRILRRLGVPSHDASRPRARRSGAAAAAMWQHLAYPAQLAAKHARVTLALAEVPAVKRAR